MNNFLISKFFTNKFFIKEFIMKEFILNYLLINEFLINDFLMNEFYIFAIFYFRNLCLNFILSKICFRKQLFHIKNFQLLLFSIYYKFFQRLLDMLTINSIIMILIFLVSLKNFCQTL